MAEVSQQIFLGTDEVFGFQNENWVGINPYSIEPPPSFAFRNDPYSASLVVACPYSNFTTLGMTNFYDNCAGAIKSGTFSSGYVLVPSGSTAGAGKNPQFYPSSSQYVTSGSFDFSAQGYETALMISGSQNAGVIASPATNANLNGNNFVVECWFNFKGGTFTNPPFNAFFFGDQGGNECLMDYANGSSTFRFFGAGSDNDPGTWTPKTNNVWFHVAWVKSGSNKYIYFNGSRIGNGTGTIDNPTLIKLLGTNAGTDNDGYGKLIQDYRVYVGTDKGYTGATITVPDSIVIQN
jgi:hypothetical protein